ncbi:hypothetical protein Tsubulata_034183 [Turnera subulata]|uniref:Uncharacterized protein n=1 Tax=Turnera subulata TaxID=218843 RepID=A0A9Q0GHK3_9ROSI|nr:hypothetical protein Tsubulata_034183 [Turnera subulata]
MSSAGSYNLRSFLQVIYRYRFASSAYSSLGHSSNKNGPGYSTQRGLQLISSDSRRWGNFGTKILKEEPVVPPKPAPPKFNFPLWARWVVGCILSVFPFWKQKLEQLKRIEGEAEIIVEGVETVAGVVEKAATAVEKASADAAEKLPENGKLKEAALFIERVSKATAHDAHETKEFFHKVDELKEDVDDLEKMVEPVIENLIHKKSEQTKNP